MIPYVIECANPSDDMRYNNIDSTYDSCEKDILDETIIKYIINYMYEYCSNDYGHNIEITSYDDFCEKYWKIKEYIIKDWYDIFNVMYFENTWIRWNIYDYKDKIYVKYKNTYKNT
jgi:hypothetical protein